MAEWMGAELPALTMGLARRRDEAQRATGEDGWRRRWAFLADVLGAEALADATGAESVEACDVTALDATFARVCAEYDRPVTEAQREQVEQRLAALGSEGIANLTALTQAVETLQRASGRQGFRAVR